MSINLVENVVHNPQRFCGHFVKIIFFFCGGAKRALTEPIFSHLGYTTSLPLYFPTLMGLQFL